MAGSWTRGVLHLLVGGACAALVGWLAFGFTVSVTRAEGLVRWSTTGLVGLGVVVAVVLLLTPQVRPAEVALARALLDVRLSEPADTRSWESRGRGLLWAVLVIVLGGTSLAALLWCVPQGAWLLLAAVADGARDDLAGEVSRWSPLALGLSGLCLLVAGVAVQPLLVLGLQGAAHRLLGPTPGDRLAWGEAERVRLLRSHQLARELHDSIGHALTAIGVQAEAGARVADRDPDFARDALERIARTTREAVGELDDVLGTLRGGGAGDPADAVPRLARTLRHDAPAVHVGGLAEVDATGARAAYRVVQEAVTNARRHGTGELGGRVGVTDGTLELDLTNGVAPDPGGDRVAGDDRRDGHPAHDAPARRGGRGLTGLRERLELLGGSLDAGPVPGDPATWRLLARLPAQAAAQGDAATDDAATDGHDAQGGR